MLTKAKCGLSSLDVYYSNKNERNVVASYNKSSMFKYRIWLQKVCN